MKIKAVARVGMTVLFLMVFYIGFLKLEDVLYGDTYHDMQAAKAAEIVEPSRIVEEERRVLTAPVTVDVVTAEQTLGAESTTSQVKAPEGAEIELLACVIYQEAGGDACSDLCRAYVGDVVLNRVEDPRFPDTLEGVLTQQGQYGRFHWTGIIWPERASNPREADAVQRAYDTARALLSGEHSELYGQGYIWQAEFEQGTDVIYLDGLYFGR